MSRYAWRISPGVLAMLLLGIFSNASLAKEKSAAPLNVVPMIDFQLYKGTWYEIARLPNRYQKHCEGDVTATYELHEDGKVKIINHCRRPDGTISVAEGRVKPAAKNEPNSKFKVRFAPAILSFLPVVWGNYWIMELAPDYSYAAIGEPSRKYFWVIARTPTLEENILQGIIERATANGYDLTTLLRTKQGL